MLNEQTIAIMNSLKLFGMARGLSERLAAPSHGELSHADFVGLLVQDEKTCRDNQRLARLLKNAKLRQQAALDDIDFAHSRGLSKQVILELANTQWIANHRNILITGPHRYREIVHRLRPGQLRRPRRLYEVGWIKRTPKSDRIERRRCQVERGSTRKVHEGVPARSGETGDGGGVILGGGSPAAVLADIDIGELGESG